MGKKGSQVPINNFMLALELGSEVLLALPGYIHCFLVHLFVWDAERHPLGQYVHIRHQG